MPFNVYSMIFIFGTMSAYGTSRTLQRRFQMTSMAMEPKVKVMSNIHKGCVMAQRLILQVLKIFLTDCVTQTAFSFLLRVEL